MHRVFLPISRSHTFSTSSDGEELPVFTNAAANQNGTRVNNKNSECACIPISATERQKMLFNNLSKIAFIGLASISFTSSADTFSIIESKPISELWLNPGMYSYHLKNDKKMNDNNYGIGAEYRYSTVSAVTVGVFNNSYRQTSHYLGWYWQPLSLGPFRVGAVIGAMNGYTKERNGNWFFIGIPTANIEYERIGAAASLMYVPSHAKDGGAITLQLRFRVF